jgi:uncharacterized membrane protein
VKHKAFDLFTLITIIASALTVVVYGQDYTPNTLTLDIYPDGSVNVEYVIEPDPLLARVNVTLFGDSYEDLLIVDSDGIILYWDSTSNGVEADTLGSSEITIAYSTQTLTNKTGSMWTVSAASEVNSIITLPKDAVLVGLSPLPIGIMILDNQATITMPPNGFRISYIIGATGVREHALTLLNNADSKIYEVKVQGLVVSEAEHILDQSRQAYELGQYSQSEELSSHAADMARDLVAVAENAANAINDTRNLILSRTGSVRKDDLDESNLLLETAEEAYNSGKYETALNIAEMAYNVAFDAAPLVQETQVLITTGIVLVVPTVSAFLLLLKIRQREQPLSNVKQKSNIDLDIVLEKKPYLRKQDKAVLEYLHETDGALITDVRDHFDISKSSGWRMIRRLKKEKLIEASMLGRETYLKLKEDEHR